MTEGPGFRRIDLQQQLNKWGDFGKLPPRKIAARLELFETPAASSMSVKKKWLIFDHLTSDDFEFIEENCNEGCGFIPVSYMNDFCGMGPRTMAIQVRIFAKKLGIFKGLLVKKSGIHRIQLPPSMKKVESSPLREVPDRVVVLIRACFPSENSWYVGRAINWALKDPPDSFRPNLPSKMITRIWKAGGIPKELIEKYSRKIEEHPKKVMECYVVGLADPTGEIPSGYCFVPGLPKKITDRLPKGCIFVTRSPCMSLRDGVLLPVMTDKPKKMRNRDWDLLMEHSFGSIFFGSSKPGMKPLPIMIARGDLDGDLYYICFDVLILKEYCKNRSPSSQLCQLSCLWLHKAWISMVVLLVQCTILQNALPLHVILSPFHH